MRSRRFKKTEQYSSKPSSFFGEKTNNFFHTNGKPFFNGRVQAKSESPAGEIETRLQINRKESNVSSSLSPSDQSENPSTPVAPTMQPVAPGIQSSTSKFIVEDTELPSGMQMRKSDFLTRIKAEICGSVDDALKGSPYNSDNCPYITAAFARYENSSALQLEQVIQR